MVAWPARMGLNRRSRRVTLLVISIVVLSLADLFVTIAFLRANWMMEANPIAEWLIRYTQSPWTLAAFKLTTVGICVAVLHRLRHYRSGEIAAWCGFGILTVMSLMWHGYARHFDESELHTTTQTAAADDLRLDMP